MIGPMRLLLMLLIPLTVAHESFAQHNSAQLLQQAELLDRQGDWSAALFVLEELLDSVKPSTNVRDNHARGSALLMAAKVARKLGQHNDALRYQLAVRRFLSQNPKNELLDEQRRENAVSIAESYLLLEQFQDAEAVLDELLQGRFGTIPTLPRIEVNLLAGAVQQLQRHEDTAKRHWTAASEASIGLLKNTRLLSPPTRLRVASLWLTAQEALGDAVSAEAEFEQSLSRLDHSDKSRSDRFDARYGLFARARLRRDLAHTEQHLRALTREPLVAARPLLSADLHSTLASLQRGMDRTEESLTTSRHAIGLYSAAATQIEQSLSSPPKTELRGVLQSKRALLSCVRRLCTLQQQLGDLSAAARSAERARQLTVEVFPENSAAMIEAQTTEAVLLAAIGNYEAACPLLTEAVAYWRSQQDVQPLKLARSLNDLSAVERGSGNLLAAVAGFREALTLRQQHLAADDPELATSLRNLAGAYTALGQFAPAIELQQQVLKTCDQLGSRADGLRSTTLLEMAITYKSQGRFPQAEDLCRQSLALQEALFGTEHFGAVAHHDALAALARLRGRNADAEQHALTMLRLCEQHHREQHDSAAAARHHLGVVAAARGQLDVADAHWRKALAIQQANGQQPSAARTWNRLGLLAHRRKQFAEAERCFESALKLQEPTSTRPQERYNSLCNLAAIRQEQGQTAAALSLLHEAIELTEAPRAATVGAEQERAEFFAQFATAFDLLIEWNLATGHFDEAFAAAERSRSRTFLDQVRLAGVDLRRTLTGEAGQALVTRETQERANVQRRRMELQSLTINQTPTIELAEAQQSLLAAQRDLADAWIAIRNASPIYRELLTAREGLLSLADIQKRYIARDEMLLYYHLGSRQSHVLLIGTAGQPVQQYSLQLSESSIASLKPAGMPPDAEANPAESSKSSRGSSGLVVSAKGAELPIEGDSAALRTGSLTRRQVAQLVTWYRSEIQQRRLPDDRTRGPDGTIQSSKSGELSSGHTVLADTLLPKALRKEIERLCPRRIVIVPDGALHQLPFESLLIHETPRPRYVLDDFPPLSYAPSANILANLHDRRSHKALNADKLLTVGDPTYLSDEVMATRAADLNQSFRGHGGQLARLPATRQECERVARTFSSSQVVMLLGAQATETRVFAELPHARWIHLAAHGLVDENFTNLFGAIALSPPTLQKNPGDDDGFMTYEEILNCPLRCELAVLSACQTNVGPERPLDFGNSLAQAFLAAGAKRVVASHWTVADDSTAELIAQYFGNFRSPVTANRRTGDEQTTDYATSLRLARLSLRKTERWSSPYFWAPFVLIGPATELSD